MASNSRGLFVALAAGHAAALAAAPTIPIISVGIWWNSNTIAHNFIHRPFFKTRTANRLFAAFLTVLLGIPQSLWRDRHLAHHRGEAWRWRVSPELVTELALISTAWAALAVTQPWFFVTTYLPAYAIGLAFCGLQGHYEHAGGVTSYYGRVYNLLCFNDGFHGEHHASPGLEWRRLPDFPVEGGRTSRWPPLLRWIEALSLEGLERLVLRHPAAQRFVLRAHRRAFAALLSKLSPPRLVAIVGGGLFPRTALILRDLLPEARIMIVDANARNLEIAMAILGSDGIESELRQYPARDESTSEFDLVVIPLSFRGDRRAIYRQPPSKAVVVHDWIWRRRGESHVVSMALLKRLNLVRQ